ncbi:hypothetical protein SS50377_25951 [Spironucleus salmonicida]|nr:hypothetical protein SS50377_25951 [Spironucleus salmonicida]
MSSYPITIDSNIQESFANTHKVYLQQKSSMVKSVKEELIQHKKLQKLQLQHKLALQQQERQLASIHNQDKINIEKEQQQLMQRRAALKQARELKQRMLTVKAINNDKQLIYLSQKETLIKKKTINYIEKEKSQQNCSKIVRNRMNDLDTRKSMHNQVVAQQTQLANSIVSKTEQKLQFLRCQRESELYDMRQIQKQKERQIQQQQLNQDDYREDIMLIQNKISGRSSGPLRSQPLRLSLVLSDKDGEATLSKNQDTELDLQTEIQIPEAFDFEQNSIIQYQ